MGHPGWQEAPPHSLPAVLQDPGRLGARLTLSTPFTEGPGAPFRAELGFWGV